MANPHDENRVPHVSLEPGDFRPPTGYKPGSGHHGHQTSFSSTRTAQHRGHTVKIKTAYRIEIDDEPLTVHTMVMDDGSVHCHGLPNYAFASAVDMAKAIIDAERLATYERDDLGGGGHDDGHDHGTGHNGSHTPTHEGDHG